jgi:hypothetical protein
VHPVATELGKCRRLWVPSGHCRQSSISSCPESIRLPLTQSADIVLGASRTPNVGEVILVSNEQKGIHDDY